MRTACVFVYGKSRYVCVGCVCVRRDDSLCVDFCFVVFLLFFPFDL